MRYPGLPRTQVVVRPTVAGQRRTSTGFPSPTSDIQLFAVTLANWRVEAIRPSIPIVQGQSADGLGRCQSMRCVRQSATPTTVRVALQQGLGALLGRPL